MIKSCAYVLYKVVSWVLEFVILLQAMNDLTGMDLVPEPKIVVAALKACRRLNDYALAIRFLESVKEKCGSRQKEIWPYVLQVF